MARTKAISDLLERMPTRDEIEARIVENARERVLLNRLLKLAQDRESVEQSAATVKHFRERTGQ